MGRDVRGGAGRAVDVDAVAVALNVAVARLLDEDERHVGPAGVEMDRTIDVQRRLLVLPLHARHAVRGDKPELSRPTLPAAPTSSPREHRGVEGEHFLGQICGR